VRNGKRATTRSFLPRSVFSSNDRRRTRRAPPQTQCADNNFYAIHNRIGLRLGARIWDLRHFSNDPSENCEFETIEQPDKNTVYQVVRQPAAKQLSIVGV
jgi:hypothetical protein